VSGDLFDAYFADPVDLYLAENTRKVKRAQQREVKSSGGYSWWVSALKGEAYPGYVVTRSTSGDRFGYWCECYGHDHGETRQRQVCTHVVAVMMWRKEHGGGEDPARSGHGGEHDGAGESGAGVAVRGPSDPGNSPVRKRFRKKVVEELPTDPQGPDVGDIQGGVPDLTSGLLNPPGYPPLPAKFKVVYDHQWAAVEQAVREFDQGADVVYLDAPTGSGKTLIAELVRRYMQTIEGGNAHLEDRSARRLVTSYVCSDKSLQAQFLHDFPYAKLIQGRANYPTQVGIFPTVHCGDCTMNPNIQPPDCDWCPDVGRCSYTLAKTEALKSDLRVLNTAYLIAEANSAGKFSHNDLLVVDECDTLEHVLLGAVEYQITPARAKRLGIEIPVKGAHEPTILKWMEEELEPAIITRIKSLRELLKGGEEGVQLAREKRGLEELLDSTKGMIATGLGENWVRDYSDDDEDKGDVGLVYKPVRIGPYGRSMVFRHGTKILCMSASIISSDVEAETTGVTYVPEAVPA
jgi:hypothetical protein